MECARRVGRNGFTAAEAATITEKASEMRRHLSADNLARFLGVTYAVRQRLGLTTIGSINVGTQARKELRKRRNRLTKERKRRALGMMARAQYEASSLCQTRSLPGDTAVPLPRARRVAVGPRRLRSGDCRANS